MAGAGIDVFAKEPCTDSPLFALEPSWSPPTSAPAPTRRRRRPASPWPGRCAWRSPASSSPTRSTSPAASSPRRCAPASPLVEKLGRIFTALAGAVPAQIDIDVRGEITQHDVSVCELAALKGLFQDVVEESVSYVNAPLLAAGAGLRGAPAHRRRVSPDFRNVTTLRGTLADGTVVSSSGTLTGPRQVEKVVEVNGFDLEVPISEHMAFFRYVDRPGIVGIVGRVLGDAGVNIAGMQVEPRPPGRRGAVVLTVDTADPGGRARRHRHRDRRQRRQVVDLDGN